ncbi:MAG: hypothetical protein DME26_21595 [Verrucomicrobia bacterium]|nr:MAG: hypothetical protein DME26_21595 [Verrucomicrobiota bacterium]
MRRDEAASSKPAGLGLRQSSGALAWANEFVAFSPRSCYNTAVRMLDLKPTHKPVQSLFHLFAGPPTPNGSALSANSRSAYPNSPAASSKSSNASARPTAAAPLRVNYI